MSWKLVRKPTTMLATKEMADKFATMDAAPQDRALSERRLEVYEKIIREGGFRPVSWAYTTCGETNGTYRVNGKHTSVLLSRLPDTPELYVVIEQYHCDTLEDVARLYATYDSKMMMRTVGDINRMFASCVPELSQVHHRTVNLVISGVAYSQHQQEYIRIPPAERAEAIITQKEFALWLHELLGGGHQETKGHGHLRRMPVVAAMFLTWQKDKEQAMTFWSAVRDETGPEPDLPDRRLSRFLLTHGPANHKTTDRPSRYRVSDREFFVKSIHSWNAWRRHERTNLRYVAQARLPNVE